MLKIFVFLFCILILISSLIILFTLKGKKPIKSKQDILFIEKQILKSIIMLIYIILILYDLLKEEENEVVEFKKYIIIFFNVYIFLMFSLNIFSCIEEYLTYINPNHYFNSIFHKSKYNFLYEGISISAVILLSLPYFYFENEKIFISSELFKFDEYKTENKTENKTTKDLNVFQNSPFVIVNHFKIIISLMINIIIIILYIILKLRLKKIIFKARGKLFRIINGKILSTILYIIFTSFNYFIFLYLYITHPDDNIELLLNKINSILFLIAYIIDEFLEFKTYSTSKFAQYKLKNTIVDSIGSCFNRKNMEEQPTNAFLESMLEETSYNNINPKQNKTNTVTEDDDEDEENSLIMPLNNNDIELVLIYRNKIFIEDYFFYFYDYIMNVTLCALYKIYRDKKFSTTILNNNNLNKELNITESAIFGDKSVNTLSACTLKKIDTQEEYSTSTINPNVDEFELIRNSQRNDFFYCDEIFQNYNDFRYDDLKIKITSYFTSKCVYNLLDKNFTSKIISESLNSHLKKNDSENENKINRSSISSALNTFLPYHSILSCNAKEEYFLHLKNMTIKTYDKQLTFDIFESNDDDISVNINNSNKKIAILLDKYFDYIKGVGVMGTFLPILIGIFKVKINSFKTMLIYISCNSLIENSPSNTYSYWQLIRFSLSNTKKVSSSKYRHNVLIGDDLIFDRKYALPSVKEDNDPSYNKIEIKNYFNFEETIKHDITFLNRCGTKHSNLLLMYFEYENAQKHEIGGAIKIRKIGDDKAEIINTTVSMPILRDDDDDESDENLYIDDLSKSKKKEIDLKLNEPINYVSESIDNDSKINQVVSNRYSDINQNLNINKNQNINNNNIIEKKEDNMKENLDIGKSMKNSDNELLKSNTLNSVTASMVGSLAKTGFLDNTMMSFDEPSGKIKNIKEIDSNNMLNYTEKIKMNSYDGYFDAFNCMCLFSFENIFDLNNGCPCLSVNYNELQKNIFNSFSSYIPRKHTGINKRKKN